MWYDMVEIDLIQSNMIQNDAMRNDAFWNDKVEEIPTWKKQLLRPLGEARGQKWEK